VRLPLNRLLERGHHRAGAVAARVEKTLSHLATAEHRTLTDPTAGELRAHLARMDSVLARLSGQRGDELRDGAREVSTLLHRMSAIANRAGASAHVAPFSKLMEERKGQLRRLAQDSGGQPRRAALWPPPAQETEEQRAARPAPGLGEDRLRLLAGAEVRAGVRESAAPDPGAAPRGKGQWGEHGADGPRVAVRAGRSRHPRGQDALERRGEVREAGRFYEDWHRRTREKLHARIADTQGLGSRSRSPDSGSRRAPIGHLREHPRIYAVRTKVQSFAGALHDRDASEQVGKVLAEARKAKSELQAAENEVPEGQGGP